MSRPDRILVAAGGGAAILAAVAAFMLLAPSGGDASSLDDGSAVLLGTAAPAASVGASAPVSGAIFVDVEGAVAEPGIRELPAGSRVADAIAAAGGYAPDVDLEAAADGINLAQALTDGQQVQVPRLGDAEAPPAASEPPAAGGGSTGGLVNLNTATPEELEALPGIGAVTVQKIVAARQEGPFASLEDALERGVINRGQLEDLQGVATAA